MTRPSVVRTQAKKPMPTMTIAAQHEGPIFGIDMADIQHELGGRRQRLAIAAQTATAKRGRMPNTMT